MRDTLGRALVMTEPNGHVTRVSYRSPFLTTESPYMVGQTKDSTTGRTISIGYVNASNRVASVSGDITRQDFVYHTGTNGPPGAIDSVLGANRTVIFSVHRPDALGRDTLILDGAQHATRFQYDSVWGSGRQATNARGSIWRVHYDAVGRVDSAWVPTSGLFTYQYDLLNRRTQVRDPLNQVTQFVYGRTTLDRVIDPKGQMYKFVYNPMGLLVARHDLGDTTRADTLKYDEAGNVRSVRTRRSDVIAMTYDLVGRLRSRSGPDFPVDSLKYDPNGRWVVAWNVNQRDSASFDQVGRLAASRQAMLGGVAYQLAYSYDIQNRLRTRTPPVGTSSVRYAYNATTGVLDTLCAVGACVALSRTSELLLEKWTYNPGLSGSWTKSRQWTENHRALADSFSVAKLDTMFGKSWTYDSLDRIRIEFRDMNVVSRRESYDKLGRLANECDAIIFGPCLNEYGTETNAYAYDSAGNRVDAAASPIVVAGNRLVAFKGYTLGYDANGTVTSKISGSGNPAYSYTWDALGRLVEVRNSGSIIANYKYDALGRRVSGTAPDGTTERYVYDRDHVILDVNGSHAVKVEYGYQPGVDRLFAIKNTQTAPWTAVVINDPTIGTVTGIANVSGGGVRKQYIPTGWGEIGPDTGVVTRFRMAGREYDQATGLYYMRARYYDPGLGRFLSEDPIGVAGGLNLYEYASSDPVNSRDPFGLCGDDQKGEKKEPKNNGGGGGGQLADECVDGGGGGTGGGVLIWNDNLGGNGNTEAGGAAGRAPAPPVWVWPFLGTNPAMSIEIEIIFHSGFTRCPRSRYSTDPSGEEGTVNYDEYYPDGNLMAHHVDEPAWIKYHVMLSNPLDWFRDAASKPYHGTAEIYLEKPEGGLVGALFGPQPRYNGGVRGTANCDLGTASFKGSNY